MATTQGIRSWPTALEVPEQTARLIRRVLQAVEASGVRFSIGGGFAMYFYGGILRPVKDFDLHVLPEDVDRVIQALQQAGFSTLMKHKQWLAQGFREDLQVDVVFGLGNWLAPVDRDWIDRGQAGDLLGHRVIFAPPEEIIWSKAFMCSRLRYDAADIFHLLVTVGRQLDWPRLVGRFDKHWEVLLSQVLMFRYVFPAEADVVPDAVLDDLLSRLAQDRKTPWRGASLCRGTLLDGAGTYDQDITERGYVDARQELWEAWERRQRRLRRPRQRRAA